MRESMEYDVVIIGAGPAGLACAIRLKQLCAEKSLELSVCIVEKAAHIGAHSLSGAVFEPRALIELLPNWESLNAPLITKVSEDQFLYFTATKHYKLPTPKPMHNEGNYIISLGKLCQFLAHQAEQLGVEIYPGFAATEVLYHDDGSVKGIATGEMGIDKDGKQTANYQQGMELHAKQTVFAEGCRGSLTKTLLNKFNLEKDCDPQTYGLGIKEIWEIDPKQHKQGLVVHSIGWPLDNKTYGGSFMYHLENNQVAIGFVIGLDYENPYLSPFEEFQRFKTHPSVKKYFNKAERIAYGARALVEGGFQSIPKLSFAGGLLIGDCAGFLNVPKIKGNHTAMKSGMVAAESIYSHFKSASKSSQVTTYSDNIKNSWLFDELYKVRNIRPAFQKGLWIGLANAALDTYIFRGKAPWTFRNHNDYECLQKSSVAKKIDYPKPDGKLSFDRLSSVFLSNTNHGENQPCHLQLIDPTKAITVNYNDYASPETRYCPAAVYEIVEQAGKPALQINAQNCVHCKTCDIKDPTQNINWVPPEGGGGPNYSEM